MLKLFLVLFFSLTCVSVLGHSFDEQLKEAQRINAFENWQVYEILEISPGPEEKEQAKRSYRRKSLMIHPDKVNTKVDAAGLKEFEEAFKKLSAAYEKIENKDPRHHSARYRYSPPPREPDDDSSSYSPPPPPKDSYDFGAEFKNDSWAIICALIGFLLAAIRWIWKN